MVTVLAAGTQADPLITQSYAEGAYLASFKDSINSLFAPVITSPLERIAALDEQVGFSFAPSPLKVALAVQDSITLKAGTSFTMTSGTAALMYGVGTVLNVTTGSIVGSGTQLTRNHRYICAENTTAIVQASSELTGYVDGYYKTTQSQITLFVERLYNIVLRRPSDVSGLQNWVGHIVSGRMTAGQVANSFFFSNEFISYNVSNEDFLDRLYGALMNRAPDPSGFDNWMRHLQAGMTRQNVFNLFVASPEFTNLCRSYGLTPDSATPPIGVRMFVTRLYAEALNRQPDASGLLNWLGHMQNGMPGTAVARSFIFSVEVANRNQTNDQFVEMLYRTLLGRDSEPAGKANWLGHLQNGMTRETVFNHFAASPEFIGICNAHNVRR